MLEHAHYEASRQRPNQLQVMWQHWRSLLFLHFRCEPALIQSMLPQGLTVDTFDGSAWVGLVPFAMRGVRPKGLPGLPGHTNFLETNLRTYVHHEGRAPGVWFFSLDAESRLACIAARALWSLPYHHATMSLHREDRSVTYTSSRNSDRAHTNIQATLGDPIGVAQPETLEFFLVERYRLYASRGEHLMDGRVWHEPYQLRTANLVSHDESLTKAAKITPEPIISTLFCEGVDVRIFPIFRAS